MDDAARLVSELQDKLAELDGKVAAYQRDMLAEFHKHMEACLKDYPATISSEVSRVIAESMSRYPYLSSTSRGTIDSPAIDQNKSWDGRKSPPPVLRHTSGIPKDAPRDPHHREKEFQGLFTPTYLPLLEKRDRIPNPVPTPISAPSTPTTPAAVPEPGMQSAPLSVENVKKVEDSKKRDAPIEDRPAPVRRLTDRSTSSVDSSCSESKIRRSALRRTSTGSSHKGSPRRVRFEFAGEEVLPSSSPQQATSALALVTGVEMLPEPATPIAIEDESPVKTKPSVLHVATEETYTTTSLLDVEGEEDSLPRPKKVSSTQALQALTRSPLEAGTTWTVVNPDPEVPLKMNGQNGVEAPETSALSTKVDSQLTIRGADDHAGWVPQTNDIAPPVQKVRRDTEGDDDEDESEDDWLSMRPKKSPSIATPRQESMGSMRLPSPATSIPASKPNGKKYVAEDEDPLFDFEDEAGSGSSKGSQKYIPDQDDDVVDDDDDDDDDEEDVPIELPRKLRGLPKAIQTATASDAERIKLREKNLPPMSPSAVLFGHSMGSYNGAAIQANPINNPKLYDEIAGMKDVHFFVGSVDGRSGVEAADMGSYRAMSKSFPATPRSFTERLAMEEAMERNSMRRRDVDDD